VCLKQRGRALLAIFRAAAQWPPLPLSPLFSYKYKGKRAEKKKKKKRRGEALKRGKKAEEENQKRRRKKYPYISSTSYPYISTKGNIKYSSITCTRGEFQKTLSPVCLLESSFLLKSDFLGK
jgi:hypothetical protein